jgi:hypothetical protein
MLERRTFLARKQNQLSHVFPILKAESPGYLAATGAQQMLA